MRLSAEGLKERAKWEEAGYALPKFDREQVSQKQPKKIHSGFILVQEIFFVHFRQTWYRTC